MSAHRQLYMQLEAQRMQREAQQDLAAHRRLVRRSGASADRLIACLAIFAVGLVAGGVV